MTQWIITSSLLILAVLVIRRFGRDRLGARLRYALWGLVLLRLLIPVSIGESVLSVQNWPNVSAEELVSTVTARRIHTADGGVFVVPQEDYVEMLDHAANGTSDTTLPTETTQTNQTNEMTETTVPAVQQTIPMQTESELRLTDLLSVVWIAGMVIVGGVFLAGNLRFWLRLRRSRRYVMTEGVPVYISAAVETPCLFGFPYPAVYVTPEVLGDDMALRHVLAHELTHYRHRDYIWSLLRCVCVTLHWYNPLVWLAAYLSQQDAELACDEGALGRLDDSERMGYAKTLLDLTCVGYRGMLTTATSMTGSESDLKTRVLRIVKNPKMSRYAIPVVLVLAILMGLALFTDEPDPLEGTWYGARSEEVSYPPGEDLLTTRATFRDGRVRFVMYRNDALYFSSDYSYTVKDDVLYLVYDGSDHTQEYPFVWVGDHGLEFYDSDDYQWSGYLSRGDPKEYVLVKDELMELLSFRDLSRNGEWEISTMLEWLEPYVMDILQRAEILSRKPMPAQLTYTDYCYGITIEENGKSVELILSDGWLYRDGVGYELSDTDPLADYLWELTWEPVGGYTDESGMRYSLAPVDGAYLEMNVHHDYRVKRLYDLGDEKAWERAWEEALEHNVTGEYGNHYEVAVYVFGLGTAVNVIGDGTVVYYEWPADENGTKHSEEHYIHLEDAPKLKTLLEPYLQVWEASVTKAEAQQQIYGVWNLTESPDPSVTAITATMNTNLKYYWTDRDVWMGITIDGTIVETEFDIYLEDGLFHIRYKDGTEETVPYTLESGVLTLHAEDGDWVFKQGAAEVDLENTDLIRFTKQESKSLRLDLTDEKLAELETLLRAGMVEREENVINTDEHFYKLLGLEDAFDTEDITVSDRGTMHFNGHSYDLTNWDEIDAFFDTLYRVKY